MSQNQSRSLPREQFLSLSGNLLYKAFQEASRTEAKRLFRDLARGEVPALTQVRMEDGSLVRFDLALDHSEYRGVINFGAFRSSLQSLITSIAKVLKEQQEIPMFDAEGQEGHSLFGVPGMMIDDEQLNVMMLGVDTATHRPAIILRLMYMDPAQFIDPDAEQVAARGGSDSA